MLHKMIAFRAAAMLAVLTSAPALAQTPTARPASAPAAPTPASNPATIPIERFAELPVLGSALLSPDGTRVAARFNDGTNERIGIWEVGASEQGRQLRSIVATGASSFSWAGDDRLLISTYSLVLLVGYTILPIPVRRVVSLDVATSRATALGSGGGFADEVIFTDPAGRYVLLSTQTSITTSPSVRHVDLVNGASVEVQRPRRGVWKWFADSHGVVRVGVDYGERRTRIYYRDAEGAELRLVDNDRRIQDDSVIDLIRFVGDTNRGVVVTNAETGRFAVYEYDFAADRRGATLFEHPEVDVTAPIFARDGTLTGISYETDRPRTHWIDPGLAGIQAAIDRTFPGKTNQILNASRDGNRLLVWSAAADDPGTYYVYDRRARRMQVFASPFDGLADLPFAPVRYVSYQSRDGLTIHGYLTLPPGRGGTDLPLVVLPHGGPFARDSWQFDQEVQFLANRGYAVFQPNFRGSTGYGRDFVARGYGQLGGGMIDDVEDGVDWLVGEHIVDRGRVCIMGSSYGGYAALWSAIRSPQRYRCAVSWAGPTDLRALVRYDTNVFVARRYVRQFREQLEGEERIDLNAISPLRQQQRLAIPVLIGHGQNDARVPVDQGRQLIRALERRHAPLESIIYPKAEHGFTTSEERADWLRRVETFLARHNPAGPRPAAAGAGGGGGR